MGFARFMASPVGRGMRVVLGLALIAWGIAGVGGTKGWIIAAVGLLPMTLGIINGCPLATLFAKAPFRGSDLPRG